MLRGEVLGKEGLQGEGSNGDKESEHVVERDEERASPTDRKSKKRVWIGAIATVMVVLVGGYLWQQNEIRKSELRKEELRVAKMREEKFREREIG